MSDRQEIVRAILEQANSDGLSVLSAPQCKAVCDAYGIPLPSEGLARSADERAPSPTGLATR